MQARTCDAVHIVNQMRPGGLETMVLDLVRYSAVPTRIFSLEGAVPDLVSGWPGLAPVTAQLDGFQRAPRLVPGLALRLAKRLRELAPQCVFLHRTGPLLYGGVAARLAGIPQIVYVEHDTWHYEMPRHRSILDWSVRLLKPVLFAVSPAIADYLRDIQPKAQIQVVPAGVDIERFARIGRAEARTELGLAPTVRVVGTAGRLEPVKGQRFLVEAMRHLPDEVRLLIAGHGSEREALVHMTEQLELTPRVRFLGHRDDLERILPALDVFCLPSVNEGLPRAIMEAQSADIPVVATDVGSVRQVVCPETGILVPSEDPAALAAAIARRLDTPLQAGVSRAYADANFSLARMVATYDDMSRRGRPRG